VFRRGVEVGIGEADEVGVHSEVSV
jgi:hypothetical protein